MLCAEVTHTHTPGPEHQLGLLSAQWTSDALLRAEELSQAPATSGSSHISKRDGTKHKSHLHRPVSGDTRYKQPIQWDRSLGEGGEAFSMEEPLKLDRAGN